MRHTKATQIYGKTDNPRAVQLSLEHTKLEITVSYSEARSVSFQHRRAVRTLNERTH